MRIGLLAIVATLGAALALVVAGCGEDEQTVGGGASTAEKATTVLAGSRVSVTETEYKLDPANPRIPQTGVVEIEAVNGGSVVHALEVEGPSGEVETGEIQPGSAKTLKVDFSRAGRYEWYCPIGDHRKRGMRGEVVVAGGGGGTPTVEGPVEDNGGGETTTEESGKTTTEDNGGGQSTTEDDSGGGGGGSDDPGGGSYGSSDY